MIDIAILTIVDCDFYIFDCDTFKNVVQIDFAKPNKMFVEQVHTLLCISTILSLVHCFIRQMTENQDYWQGFSLIQDKIQEVNIHDDGELNWKDIIFPSRVSYIRYYIIIYIYIL